MELPPMQVNLLEFFKTGVFDGIKLGNTKELMLSNYPPPDDYGIGTSINDAKIWYYGGIEFHFDEVNLFLIYSDHIKDIHSTGSIKLDKWILNTRRTLSLQQVLKALITEKIDFTKFTNNHWKDEPSIEIVLAGSEVKFKFLSVTKSGERINDPNLYFFFSFNVMNLKKPDRKE